MVQVLPVNENAKPVRTQRDHDGYFPWFEPFRVEGALYHGSDNPDLESEGLSMETYLTQDSEFARMYGHYLYRVVLPSNCVLTMGEDEDQFMTIKDVSNRYVKRVC